MFLVSFFHFNFFSLAIWLLPTDNTYGIWPRSGEIDLLESRGNRKYMNGEGKHIGVEHFGSTLHFGPAWNRNGYWSANFASRTLPGNGYNKAFHKFQLEWAPDKIDFFVDDCKLGSVRIEDGFWARGKFEGENIWRNGTKAAPFDQEVIIPNCGLLNLNAFGQIYETICFFDPSIVSHPVEPSCWWNKWLFSRSRQ